MANINEIYREKIEQQMRLLLESVQEQNGSWEKEKAALKARYKGQIRVSVSHWLRILKNLCVFRR